MVDSRSRNLRLWIVPVLAAGLLAIAALAASGPASAHFRLAGGHKCGFTLSFGPQPSGQRAFDVKVKRLSCRAARGPIRGVVEQRDTSFDCRGRVRDDGGDQRYGDLHHDYKCADGRRRVIFAVAT